MDFADVEARQARAIIRHLANRTAVVGGVNTRVIYDDKDVEQQVGDLVITATGPRFAALTTELPAAPAGVAVVIDGSNYLIRDAQPDGAGITRCMLTETA